MTAVVVPSKSYSITYGSTLLGYGVNLSGTMKWHCTDAYRAKDAHDANTRDANQIV